MNTTLLLTQMLPTGLKDIGLKATSRHRLRCEAEPFRHLLNAMVKSVPTMARVHCLLRSSHIILRSRCPLAVSHLGKESRSRVSCMKFFLSGFSHFDKIGRLFVESDARSMMFWAAVPRYGLLRSLWAEDVKARGQLAFTTAVRNMNM